MLYQRFDVDEETPVQFVAVHPLRWRPEWGEPTDMFREVDLADVPEVAALVEAATRLKDIDSPLVQVFRRLEEADPDWLPGDVPMILEVLFGVAEALAPFLEIPDAS